MVTHLPNVLYLTGFSGSAGLLLVARDRTVLFTDSRYTLQARQEITSARVQIAKHGILRAAGEELRRMRRRGRLSVAYSPGQTTVAEKAAIDTHAAGKLRWIAAGNLIERLRAIKDDDEISRMAASAQLISDVFAQVLPVLRPGVPETTIAAEIDYRMRTLGAAGPSFESIVASGPRSAWPHARPSAKLLMKNELVVLDQGAILRAYCSDMTRTIFLGRGPKKIRAMYSAVLAALEAAKAVIRPGIEAEKIDKTARDVLKRHNLAGFFTHSTGHGLGLEVHEMPRLGRGESARLETGMVVTVEPGVYVEGLGGIRIEDDVVVTPRGAQVLTTASREFFEL
ncbi:MAG TPA: aminopeptidase P family protein [Candidatus Acidoferrales bacterium]|nr:aminopeptidase P family protein [Candidatus Acidoferrales bacterium]